MEADELRRMEDLIAMKWTIRYDSSDVQRFWFRPDESWTSTISLPLRIKPRRGDNAHEQFSKGVTVFGRQMWPKQRQSKG